MSNLVYVTRIILSEISHIRYQMERVCERLGDDTETGFGAVFPSMPTYRSMYGELHVKIVQFESNLKEFVEWQNTALNRVFERWEDVHTDYAKWSDCSLFPIILIVEVLLQSIGQNAPERASLEDSLHYLRELEPQLTSLMV